LTLKDEEFLNMKEEYVSEVIEILRKKAKNEADLLFKEYAKHGGRKTLVDLSMEISKIINSLTDTTLDKITSEKIKIKGSELYEEIVLRHCPPILVRKFKDRILDKLPYAHQLAIIASFIASYVVYREGLEWLDSLDDSDRFKAVITYMGNDQKVKDLIKAVSLSDLENKEHISKILQRSAARELTEISLEI
jgi:glutamate dehydrogenase